MRKTIISLAAGMAMSCLSMSAQSWLTPDVEREANELLQQMTPDEKLQIIGGRDVFYTYAIPRLGIASMYLSDATLGVRNGTRSTAYPASVMLAATWNPGLARRRGESLGRDCRARGIDILLGPGVNIYRAPMCGRNFEYMGEDPFLASRVAVELIKGVQSQGVMATVKHFFGNNSDYDRHMISNDMDERTMHEIYFPAFKAAVQEGEVAAVMTSYNLVDGVYTTESPWLLKDVLRDRWGFKGLVMSDWDATHHTIPAVTGGLDLEMPSARYMNAADLKYYLRTGHIDMKQIDEKVLHILRVMLAFGLKDGRQPDKSIPMDDPQSAAMALDEAREGIVLLKNKKNILPLRADRIKKIAVVGRNATGHVNGGGSSCVAPNHFVSNLDGLREAADQRGIEVEYVDIHDYMPDIFRSGENNSVCGLKAEYFANRDLQGEPVATLTDTKVMHHWDGGTGINGVPTTNFSVRWSGALVPQEAGQYRLRVGADDGYRLFVNGEKLADDWHDGSFRAQEVTLDLKAGETYEVVVEYYQGGGGAAVEFSCDMSGRVNPQYIDRLKDADLVVAYIGHDGLTEGEGFDRTFELPSIDAAVMNHVKGLSTPVVAVVNAGGNVEMQGWEPGVDALLWSWFPGQEGGMAVAEILFGDINPSGKLPMTFEKRWEDNPCHDNYHDTDGDKHVAYNEGVFVGYRGYEKLGREVMYPFGYGLSYTTFRLSDMRVEPQNPDGTVTVSCRVTNTGRRAGAEVVQAYVGKDPATPSKVERPLKELRGFGKIYLQPGQSDTVSITLSADSFKYYDVDSHDFVSDPGRYVISLGTSSADIKASRTIDCK